MMRRNKKAVLSLHRGRRVRTPIPPEKIRHMLIGFRFAHIERHHPLNGAEAESLRRLKIKFDRRGDLSPADYDSLMVLAYPYLKP